MPRTRSKSKKFGNTELCFHVDPFSEDELVLRQSIQNAMEQTFGLTHAFTYFKFVDKNPQISELKIATATMYASHFKAALAAYSGNNRFSFLRETTKPDSSSEGEEEDMAF
ncbi:hypothetical protein FRC14_005578 [Serendipita sp. 396]|nr:hypothetical protein FRC14_005578 [Serendipita sp. 396]KAG8789247.1 hypothetical protein FRC15_010083 [Serendipita sp. 397]KAG8804464.1 hypothetical protein FRC16_007873 [Serendipita sp. 398]KAG8827571.1 hypothetical protein FRC19_002264 [Serendipita sp. 401]KAG8860667.1 hypothetical protein FRB91_001782 [Serendipita sp. 411]KAG8878425.1 hypothetical protein FRC20_008348 [Serendipita sp. 405]KAG9057948.1 hypothetical protein FS842_002640 [Serendipita sp. 407]